MDTQRFEIHNDQERIAELMREDVPVQRLTKREVRELDPMDASQRKNWMRNKPCPCGSGKKFKRCHW